MMLIKALKDKRAYAVEGLVIVTIMILVFLFGIQTINVLTTAQKVRQRTKYSLSLLEASITEDIYSSLTEKQFDYYKDLILNENDNELKNKYNEKFFDLLKENLPYDNTTGDYIGQTFKIKGDSVVLKVEPQQEENSIKLSVIMDVQYTAKFPFANKSITFITNQMNVTSDYNFFDIENSNENSDKVNGNGQGYIDKRLR